MPPSRTRSVSLLPRRTPGSSGITGMPAEQPVAGRAPRPTPAWTRCVANCRSRGGRPTRRRPTTATSSAAQPGRDADGSPESSLLLTPRRTSQPARESATTPAPTDPDPGTDPDTDPGNGRPTPIYQRMLSESVGNDPHEPDLRADLDWQSVWDRGWSVAAEAENVPVVAHTEHGLPVREPGARLVPGSAEPDAPPRGTRIPIPRRTTTAPGSRQHPLTHRTGRPTRRRSGIPRRSGPRSAATSAACGRGRSHARRKPPRHRPGTRSAMTFPPIQ